MQYQKNLTLRDGTLCVLRNAGADDAEHVLRIFNLTHTQTEFLLTYPGESPMTVENERDFLAQSAASSNSIEICAVIVGTAGITPIGSQEKLRHRAEFGISIDRAYWGRGIGRALTEACIECAKTAGYTQLELDVVAENTAARMLYEHVGWPQSARFPHPQRRMAGAYFDALGVGLKFGQNFPFIFQNCLTFVIYSAIMNKLI